MVYKIITGLSFILFCFACKNEVVVEKTSKVIPPKVLPYPDTDFDFLGKVYSSNDTIPYRAKVEILRDSNQYFTWHYNNTPIKKEYLIDSLHETLRSFPENKRSRTTIDLGIHPLALMESYISLRDSIRGAGLLSITYMNDKGKKSLTRYPPAYFYRTYNGYANKSRVPEPFFSSCLCCKHKNKYVTYSFKSKKQTYESASECLKRSKKIKDRVHIELRESQIFWEGQPIDLAYLQDSLNVKFDQCTNANRFIIFFYSDLESSFQSYLDCYAICRKFYIDQWDKVALADFGSKYEDLRRFQKRDVRTKIPFVLSQSFKGSDN